MTSGFGHTSTFVTIPNDRDLVGAVLVGQAAVLDAIGGLGLTNALRLLLGD